MSPENPFDRQVFSVSELTGKLRDLIESEFGLIWLSGEISNLRRPSSGHMYLTLKDQGAQIRGVMFRTKTRYLDFSPQDGHEVLVRGRLSLYEPRGEYQLVIEYMEPRGEGALRLAFEKLKERLAAEGLFDQDRKKPLPFLPHKTALVTSPTGAAVRDFIRVARRRFDSAALSIYPVRVQGQGAAEEMAAALADLNRWGGFDVIVLTRGGGSLEDLWAFNEEVLVRAVAESEIPVVSAVGHEIDFSIVDFAADLRAPTPSAAAALIFREKKELKAHIEAGRRRLGAGVRGRLGLTREKLAHLQTRLGDPSRALADRRLRLEDLSEDLILEMKNRLEKDRRRLEKADLTLAPLSPRLRLGGDRQRLAALFRDLKAAEKAFRRDNREKLAGLGARLGALSPLAVLQRGYALARRGPSLKPVRSSAEVSPGERLDLILAQGRLGVIVDEVME